MTRSAIQAGQIESFGRLGYLRVNGLFDADEVDLLYRISKADRELVGQSYGRRDASGQSTRLTLRNELDDHTIYTAIVRSERVAGTMERLLGDRVASRGLDDKMGSLVVAEVLRGGGLCLRGNGRHSRKGRCHHRPEVSGWKEMTRNESAGKAPSQQHDPDQAEENYL